MIRWLKNNFQKLALLLAGGFACLLAWVFFFGENGFLDYRRLKEKNRSIIEENALTRQENMEMDRLVTRLQDDLVYIEHVARKELGMVGRDEQVYTLKKPGGAHEK